MCFRNFSSLMDWIGCVVPPWQWVSGAACAGESYRDDMAKNQPGQSAFKP